MQIHCLEMGKCVAHGILLAVNGMKSGQVVGSFCSSSFGDIILFHVLAKVSVPSH